MPGETGIWTKEEAREHHDFSYRLAQWIGAYFEKNEALIDFGCGPGSYLRYLHDIGYKHLLGVEGEKLNFEYGNVIVWDLCERTAPEVVPGFGSGWAGFNSICLEVGEHIPEVFLPVFLDNLAMYTRNRIVLSWGVPGQDGIGHVSCRHNIWVIDQMEKRGFKLLAEDSLKARAVVEERLNYFRNTIMIFQKK